MIPEVELTQRLSRLQNLITEHEPDWEVAVISKKISLYYLTGTLANGILWLPREGEPKLFIRKGYDRAIEESAFKEILHYNSYRDIARIVNNKATSVLLEKSTMTLSGFELFNRYFMFREIKPIENILSQCMAVKTNFELDHLKKAGQIHAEVLEKFVPDILKEGISEAELGAEILRKQIYLGSHGLARFDMPDTEMFLGYLSFSENGLVATNFDGPDGTRGNCPAVTCLGSPDRRLKNGDTVFIDTACGYKGYHTDKTCVYTFGNFNNPQAEVIQQICADIISNATKMLKPGAIPSEIYKKIVSELPDNFLDGFMGCPSQQVNFLGHGIGLHVDEYPVIAPKFDIPLEKNMVVALEPKKGISGAGMLGTENTFIVTENGGESISGNKNDFIRV